MDLNDMTLNDRDLNDTHISLTKQAWRRWAKQTRAGLDISTCSVDTCELLFNSALIAGSKHILAYMPTPQEIDVRPLLVELLAQGKHIYLTRTWQQQHQLSVHELTGEVFEVGDMLEHHRFGYLQPRAHIAVASPSCLELVLVPGLCFDRTGGRLGYGMGYFDRLLAKANQASKIGIASHELIVKRLPQAPTDIRMDYLATDKEIWRCSSVQAGVDV